MSISSNLGIPDERAKEISKEYARLIRPIFESGKLSGSGSIDIIMGMKLTDIERTWFAYHIGGINRILLSPEVKDVTINW